MTFGPESLASRLAQFEQRCGAPTRFVIAFSGGLDSTVLAHALASVVKADQRFSAVPVLAVHIDHQLQAEASAWREQCQRVAAEFGIEFRSLQVAVDINAGSGPEAAARDARYQALQAEVVSGDWLLSAHHSQDQAETLLINLIRGSGPAGIAAIGGARRFGPAWLLRPLLEDSRANLEAYAKQQDLRWVEDPSNSDPRFDRNFLRHEVMPRLASRWPDVAKRLQRSAGHAREASELLDELAAIDLENSGDDARRLPVAALGALSAGRQRNLIRFALRTLGLTLPTTALLERVLREVPGARADAQPLVEWPGAAVRRYRNCLYLLPDDTSGEIKKQDFSGNAVDLGGGLGQLVLEQGPDIGIEKSLLDGKLTVKARSGGERFSPYGQSHTRELKKLLQDAGVVPWMRNRIPLLYRGEQLLAVGDLWIAAEAAAKPGLAVRWQGRPALH